MIPHRVFILEIEQIQGHYIEFFETVVEANDDKIYENQIIKFLLW